MECVDEEEKIIRKVKTLELKGEEYMKTMKVTRNFQEELFTRMKKQESQKKEFSGLKITARWRMKNKNSSGKE